MKPSILKKELTIPNINIEFTFLNHLIDYMDVTVYYQLLYYIDHNMLSNIYYYIRIKWQSIQNEIKAIDPHSLYLQKELDKYYNITPSYFDELMNSFINKNIVLSIFVINSIQMYLHPIL